MGDIGVFKIVSEGGVSSGVRRIEAVAGRAAVAWMQDMDQARRDMARALKSPTEQLNDRVMQLLERARELEKTVNKLKSEQAASAGADLLSQVQSVEGVSLVVANLGVIDPSGLRDTVDQLKHKLGSGVVVLAAEADDGLRLVVGVTKDLTARIKAGELVGQLASQLGGKGGGRPDFAQAGGSDLQALPAVLDGVADWLKQRLS
jgi:alanyl-tRNA synthetase